MTDALDYAATRKFEQDPVRQALLEAFASLPVRLFSVTHLASLERILGDAFAAADRSTAPPEMQQSREFRDACPSSATAMRLVLSPEINQ